MKDIEKMTIDELLNIFQWAKDKAAYYRACGKSMPGTLYAKDCAAEAAACRELCRRGYGIAK